MADYDPRPSKRHRSRSPSPPPSHHSKPYRSSRHDSGTHSRPDSRTSFRPSGRNSNHDRPLGYVGGAPQRSAKDLIRLNQIQEDERMRAWVAQEDDFVLKQAKKKAEIRVKDGRARPVDWLAVILRAIEGDGDEGGGGFEEVSEEELEYRDPESVIEECDEVGLGELKRDIESYEKLEGGRRGREYWRMMGVVVKDRLRRLRIGGPEGRAVGTVQMDIDRLLKEKSLGELEGLEKQIRAKLDSGEPIDTDYWGQLLDSLLVWKAKARLTQVWRDVIEKRMEKFRKEQVLEAGRARRELASRVGDRPVEVISYEKGFDPNPMLSIPIRDKSLESIDETTFLNNLEIERQKVIRQGYIPAPKSISTSSTTILPLTIAKATATNGVRADSSTTAFDKLVARGVDEDEEVFNAEDRTSTTKLSSTSGLRKPLSFNRVQLGYDWNKYNQTHYDADNPPPRVVQGYKFHIFYPDLPPYTTPSSGPYSGQQIPTKAPTYKIIRENGRKKGESLAAAGEEDMCIIRFSAGAPYEDIAFRIVDRDWDYSGKEGRGFKSVFADGVLSLWFSFKKVYYRK